MHRLPIKHKYNSDLNWMKTSMVYWHFISISRNAEKNFDQHRGRVVWGRFDRQTWGRFGHTPGDVLVWRRFDWTPLIHDGILTAFSMIPRLYNFIYNEIYTNLACYSSQGLQYVLISMVIFCILYTVFIVFPVLCLSCLLCLCVYLYDW